MSQNDNEGKDLITIEDDCKIFDIDSSKNGRTNTEVLFRQVLAPPVSGVHVAEIETQPTKLGFSRIFDYFCALF